MTTKSPKESKQKESKHERILVVDIATSCWRNRTEMTLNNPKQQNTIIEIGVVPLSLTTLQMGVPTSFLIRSRYTSISNFCTNITGITQEMVDGGILLKEAIAILKKDFNSQEIPIATFGFFDIKMVRWQCEKFKLEYPFGAGYTNLKTDICSMLGISKTTSLFDTMKIAGLEFNGRYHRAIDNAANTAKLIIELYSRVRQMKSKEILINDNPIKPQPIICVN